MSDEFEHTITEHPGIVEVKVRGRLDAARSAAYLVEVGEAAERVADMNGGSCGLVFIDELTWFEAGAAAKAHGQWFWTHKKIIGRVAIVSPKPSMPMAASIAILISRKEIKVFTSVEPALAWIRE